MTVHALRDPQPAVVTGWLEVAAQSVDAAAAVPLGSVGPSELKELVGDLAVLESKVAALKLDALAEADARKVAEETADTGTDAWAAKLTGSTAAVMRGGIVLANLLRERYGATREAFAAGGINEAQARVIVLAAERMPKQVTEQQRREAEAGLVVKAVKGMNARGLRQAARRMLDRISEELADQHEADELDDEEKKAEVKTELELWDNGDGTYSGKFTIPELQGRMLLAALERLTAPRVLSRNQAGEPVRDDTMVGEAGKNWYEKMGAAFTEIIEHLPTQGHGGVAATLLVKINLEHLRNGLASAGLDTGVHISAGEARRLACNAGIVPVVLNGVSEPLDVGREKRQHTTAQRRALSVQYDTCATEGCDRPFAWCDVHHPHAWSDGGGTSLANARPLCGHHHLRAHDDRFTLRVLPSGEVRFRRRR